MLQREQLKNIIVKNITVALKRIALMRKLPEQQVKVSYAPHVEMHKSAEQKLLLVPNMIRP